MVCWIIVFLNAICELIYIIICFALQFTVSAQQGHIMQQMLMNAPSHHLQQNGPSHLGSAPNHVQYHPPMGPHGKFHLHQCLIEFHLLNNLFNQLTISFRMELINIQIWRDFQKDINLIDWNISVPPHAGMQMQPMPPMDYQLPPNVSNNFLFIFIKWTHSVLRFGFKRHEFGKEWKKLRKENQTKRKDEIWTKFQVHLYLIEPMHRIILFLCPKLILDHQGQSVNHQVCNNIHPLQV